MFEEKPTTGRFETYDAVTQTTNVTYLGSLEENKAARINDAKDLCGKAILKSYPEYKQMNVGLGLITGTEAEAVLNGVQAYRNRCNQIEVAINNAQNLDEVWEVVVDFSDVEV